MAKQTTFDHPPGKHIALLAYDLANDTWRAVRVSADGQLSINVAVDTSGLLTELQAKLETADLNLDASKDLQVDVKTMPTTTVQAAGGDKIFSFESVVEEYLYDYTLDAGANTLTGTAVPSGKVWKVTALSFAYTGTSPTNVMVSAFGLATNLVFMFQLLPVSAYWYTWDGEIYLQAGDAMRIYVTGATAGDDLDFQYAGVQMDAP